LSELAAPREALSVGAAHAQHRRECAQRISEFQPESLTPIAGTHRQPITWQVRERLNWLAWLLDSSIPIPGTRLTIGLDALIGCSR
jgi:hypothetical protein